MSGPKHQEDAKKFPVFFGEFTRKRCSNWKKRKTLEK